MARRIRVFFINCPTIDTDAAAFLILSQNQVQSALQFEVYHFWAYEVTAHGPLKGTKGRIVSFSEESFHSRSVRYLERKYRQELDLRAAPEFSSELSSKTWQQACENAISAHDAWLNASRYPLSDAGAAAPAIVITETPLRGRFISYCTGNFAVHSAANWKDFFGPAAGLEYILTEVQRLSLRLAFGPGIGSHYPTRGCLWDFHMHQPDSRISSFLGFLCDTCLARLQSTAQPFEVSEVKRLLTNSWIGSETDPSSVAGILKKNYKYSLTRSTSLNPGILAPIGESLKSEFGKFVMEILKWVLIILAGLVLLAYFPAAAEKIQKAINVGKESGAPIAPTTE